ncbi:MAG: hypothetical protein RL095_1210 [Verrucomicrobiota bacterium]|jgi:23S rRNA (adenine(2503)-C(2))-methyltransferase
MNSQRIADIVAKHGLEKFRAKQIADAFFRKHVRSWSEVAGLSAAVKEKLAAEEPVLRLSEHKLLESCDRRTYKALLKLGDGRIVESVLMEPIPGHWTACISCQVGCAMACTFCATGRMGLLRNMDSEEISDQVLYWRQFMAARKMEAHLSNIVYMGMGEPFHNRRHVFDSIDELTHAETFGMGSRHISVSTSGLVKGIEELAERHPQVNLALSLHAANDELRDHLMPVANKATNLAGLAESLTAYLKKTNRKVFLEYILLDGDNDSQGHAESLANWINRVHPKHLLHVNLIVYNQTDSAHRESSKERARSFMAALEHRGVSATIRKNLGRDIDGACGQLAVMDQK